MSRYQLSRLTEDVAALLGESLALECETSECPFPNLEARVRIIAPGILSSMIMDAPLNRLDGWKPLTAFTVTEEEGTASLVLPADFLRIGTLKMKSWKCEITQIISLEHPEWSFQRSRHPGIKGSAQRPRAILRQDASGKQSLTLIPTSDGDFLEYAWYLPVAPVGEDDSLEIPLRLYAGLIRKIAEEIKR